MCVDEFHTQCPQTGEGRISDYKVYIAVVAGVQQGRNRPHGPAPDAYVWGACLLQMPHHCPNIVFFEVPHAHPLALRLPRPREVEGQHTHLQRQQVPQDVQAVQSTPTVAVAVYHAGLVLVVADWKCEQRSDRPLSLRIWKSFLM